MNSATAATRPARRRAKYGDQSLLAGGFLVAHVVLALAVRASSAFATLHAIATLLVGVFVAVVRPRRQVAFIVVYIAASEVLWRMARGVPVHEFAKYAVAAILGLSMLRFRPRHNRALALGYVLFLLPSAYLTFTALDLDDARQQISFNLSGPISLAVCVLYFSQLKVSPQDVRKMFLGALGPFLSIAIFSLFSTLSHENLEFKNGSNSAVTGGFGPNQVSAALGMGLLFAVLLIFARKTKWRQRAPLVGLAGLFAIQAMLTFSRGGIAIALASIFVALVYLVRDRRSRIALVVVTVLFTTVGYYVIFPRLEEFTNGKLTERYTNTNSSNRITFAKYDLQIFEDNMSFGVGPGMATDLRDQIGIRGIAHTEFTRMLAEHGTFGALAILLLFTIGLQTLKRTHELMARATVAALLSWTWLFLAIDAMRLVAPSIALGIACAISFSAKEWRTQT